MVMVFMICDPHRLLSEGQVKENKMAGNYYTYGRKEK